MATPGGQRGGGRVLARRYHLQRVLGRGAMGAVWEAEDTFLRRTVAVKEVVLPGSLSPEERAVSCERTLREARAIARLGHPNVVTLFDVLDEDARPWVVMELVPSRSLAEVIKEDGPLHPLRVATVGLAILGALEAAHAAGITHRDVKPGNILLGHDGRVKLTDFGIARAVGDDTITGTGLLVGSPSYIAPEIVKGQEAGAPADLWGLGATLYAAVEGRAPFSGGDAMETLSKVVQEPPTPYVRAGALTPALAAMLEKDPEKRSRPVDARRQLLDVLRGGNDAEPPARPAAAPRPSRDPSPAPSPASGPALADLLVPVWRQDPIPADAAPAGAVAGPPTAGGPAAGPAVAALGGAAAAGRSRDGEADGGAESERPGSEAAAGAGDAAEGRAGGDAPGTQRPVPRAAAVPPVAAEPGGPGAAAAAPAGMPAAVEGADPVGPPVGAQEGAARTAGRPGAAQRLAADGTPVARGTEPASTVGTGTAERARAALSEDELVDPDVAGPDLLDGDLDGETRVDLVPTPYDGWLRSGPPAGPGRESGPGRQDRVPGAQPVDRPGADQPGTDKLGTDKPGGDQPGAQETTGRDRAGGGPHPAAATAAGATAAGATAAGAAPTAAGATATGATAAGATAAGATAAGATAAVGNSATSGSDAGPRSDVTVDYAAWQGTDGTGADRSADLTVDYAAWEDDRAGAEPVETDPSEQTVTLRTSSDAPPRPSYGGYGGRAPDGDSELPTQKIAPLPFGGSGGAQEPARAFRAEPPGARPLDFATERPPADRRRRSAAALGIVVGLLVVVVVGAVLLVNVLRGGSGGGDGGGDPGGASASAAAPRPPAGYTTFKGSGFSVAVPAGWPSAVQREGVVDVREPDSSRFIRLITVDSTAPAVEQLTVAEKQFAADPTYQSYRRVKLDKVDYRGLDAADWEFTFTLKGVARHVIYRGIVTGGGTYGLYLSAPEVSWAKSRSVFQNAADTFTTS